MPVRQSTPLPNLALAAGASTEKLHINGQRVTIVSLTGATTLQCAIDGGAYQTVATNFPINTGVEEFSTVQFKNPAGTSITFEAEIGWAERPDNRSGLNGVLPISGTVQIGGTAVTQELGASISPSAVSTLATANSLDIAANAARRLLVIYNDGSTTVWLRDQAATTLIGIPIVAKEKVSLPIVGACRIRNNSGTSADIYVTELL